MAVFQQARSVDPFSSYESDNVSRLTRMVTAVEDRIMRDQDIFPFKESSSVIRITDGVCVKDDILIHIKDENTLRGYQDLNIGALDPADYVSGSLIQGPFPKKTYIVLTYTYVKTPQPPVARILILEDLEAYNPAVHVFLGVAVFNNTNIVFDVLPEDTDPSDNYPPEYLNEEGWVVRPVANLTDGYTDSDARAADAHNPITNHKAADPDDYSKIVRANPQDGSIEFFDAEALNVVIDSDEYGYNVSNELVVDHNLDRIPFVQVVDKLTSRAIQPGAIAYVSMNQFRVTFDPIKLKPSVYVIYR